MQPKENVFYRNLRKNYPVVDKAKGIYVWDNKGKKYIDGSGGAVVVSIGHSVPEIREAMIKQAEKASFIHSSHFTSDAVLECAELLCNLTPEKNLNKVYFLSGGSEAVESAIKLVRQYWREAGQPDKYKIISRWSSFHGNTTGALALGGHTSRRKHYLAIMQYTPHIEPPYCFRCAFNETPDNCSLQCADNLERAILHEGPDSVAAFIAEPVIGATAGAIIPIDGYWQRIRQICDKYDIKLIADEVMTGIGRCGKNFCMDHWNTVPDIIVLAKGLSSGYTPLGAVIAKEEIHQTIKRGSGLFVHGHTFGQNPLSAAVGAAVLKYINKKNLIERSRKMGTIFNKKLKDELSDIDIVGDVRGLGLFSGIEFVCDKNSNECFENDLKINSQVAKQAFSRGLISYPGGGGVDGMSGDHILLAPPLIITEKQIDELVSILKRSILAVQGSID
ncbi:MAG: aspartate aminotransferase family protein [Desulfobacterales bacterium]|nr:aspartate aminotransferase family protein [Desulfobacterales bacterium]